MGGGVARGGNRLHLGVAELDDLAVGKRAMAEIDACAFGQIRRRSVLATNSGRPET
jgi:hypothetical protein